MARFLMFFGLTLVLVGVFWPWLQKLGLGRLPGDIVVERENFTFHFPLATMLIVSAALMLFFNVIIRFLGKF